MDIRKVTDFFNLTTPYDDPTSPKKEVDSTENPTPLRIKPTPVEEIFAWEETIAPYKISKKIVRSGVVFLALFMVFLILVGDWMFLLLLLGLAFLLNLIINSPAKKMEYKIFSNGIDYAGTFLSWDELNHFFYYEGNENLIVVTTKDQLPGRLYLYVSEKNKSKIDELLNKNLEKKLFHPKDFFEIIIFNLKSYLNLSDEKEVK